MNGNKWAIIEKARDTLQLGEDATLAEIKRSYHRLSKRYHPDGASGKGEADSEKMYQLTAAYEQLMEYCAEYRFPLVRPKQGEPDAYNPEEWWLERFGDDPLWGVRPRKRK